MSYSEHSIREYESDSIQYVGIICLPIMPACLMEACTLHSKVSMTCVITLYSAPRHVATWVILLQTSSGYTSA